MPPLPGEESLVTLFADVHYYLNPPESIPVHDRFARASYVYLYHHPLQRTLRLEIANHAGTPQQDAFSGRLDRTVFEQRQRQPNLVTLTVDPKPELDDAEAWRLPCYDPRREKKYSYRLHSLDVYFWTATDASKFLDLSQRHVSDNIFKTAEASRRKSSVYSLASNAPYEHRDALHPVIEKLEHAAISEPYEPKAIRGELAQSESSDDSARRFSYMPSRAGTPPPQAVPGPPAYNPAAPAAPEQIAHREKTPPPPELHPASPPMEAGTHGAMLRGQDRGTSVMSTTSQQAPHFAGPPTPAGLPSPPMSPPANTSAQRIPPSFPGPPQYATFPAHQPGMVTPLQSPSAMSTYATPLSSPTYFPTHLHQQQQYNIPPPPATPGFGPPPTSPIYQHGSIPLQTHHDPLHSTFYQPTEVELAAHGGHMGSHSSLTAATLAPHGYGSVGGLNAGQAAPGLNGVMRTSEKVDGRLSKVEKGVDRFLRRLDRKI